MYDSELKITAISEPVKWKKDERLKNSYSSQGSITIFKVEYEGEPPYMEILDACAKSMDHILDKELENQIVTHICHGEDYKLEIVVNHNILAHLNTGKCRQEVWTFSLLADNETVLMEYIRYYVV